MESKHLHRLAVVTTHPIQYNAPLFEMLCKRKILQLKVFYTWGQSEGGEIYDIDFNMFREWDIPLLEGYDFVFIENISQKPGSHHYCGINNPDLIKQLKAYDPNTIMIIGWKFKSHFTVMRYFKNVTRLIIRGDSTLLDDDKLSFFTRLIKILSLRFVYKYIDHALYVGLCNREYYKKYSSLGNDQLHFAPHVINLLSFQDKENLFEQKAIDWKIRLGIKKSEFVFLYAGKFEEKKNVELLINAFLKINEPSAKLILAGNGVLLPEYEKLIDKNPNIFIIGFQNQSQMPIVYRLCDVFVLPSKGPGETWGLSINEAMACSKPVIVSDKCGAAKDLVDFRTGWVFYSEILSSLIYCLKSAIMKKNKIVEMGNAAKENVSKNDIKTFAISVENVCLNCNDQFS